MQPWLLTVSVHLPVMHHHSNISIIVIKHQKDDQWLSYIETDLTKCFRIQEQMKINWEHRLYISVLFQFFLHGHLRVSAHCWDDALSFGLSCFTSTSTSVEIILSVEKHVRNLTSLTGKKQALLLPCHQSETYCHQSGFSCWSRCQHLLGPNMSAGTFPLWQKAFSLSLWQKNKML